MGARGGLSPRRRVPDGTRSGGGGVGGGVDGTLGGRRAGRRRYAGFAGEREGPHGAGWAADRWLSGAGRRTEAGNALPGAGACPQGNAERRAVRIEVPASFATPGAPRASTYPVSTYAGGEDRGVGRRFDG